MSIPNVFVSNFFCEFWIDVRPAKMSFLMQNHVFYRSFLIWQIRMKALQSGADDNKIGLQNRRKIDEKWSQNGYQNRSFFQWLQRRLSASILERFGTILGSTLPRFGAKNRYRSILKEHQTIIEKVMQGSAVGCRPRGGVCPYRDSVILDNPEGL